MPDEKGKLSLEERDRVAKFINSKAKLPGDPCPVCGDEDTRVGEELVAAPAGSAQGIMFGRALVAVPVICENCGFIRFFHAAASGIIPLPEEPGD